jgi:Flavin reductase like domain
MQMPTVQTLDLSAGFRNAMHGYDVQRRDLCGRGRVAWHDGDCRQAGCTKPPALLVCVNTATAFNGAFAHRLPYLINAQANFFCKMESLAHFETHGIFIGRLAEVRFAKDASPPVYRDGHYVTTARLVDP